MIGEDGSVGVAVMGHATVGPYLHHCPRHSLGSDSAGLLVDVPPVGRVVDGDHLGAATAERLGRHGERRPVGAVDDQSHALQRSGRNGLEVPQIPLASAA